MDEIILTQEEMKMDNFKLYPNPANQYLNILLSTIDNVILIYNLQGELVKNSFVSTNYCKLNITDLSSGMYVVEVKNNKGRNFQKFIIE
jgi:hypothetical protein